MATISIGKLDAARRQIDAALAVRKSLGVIKGLRRHVSDARRDIQRAVDK
jgi:hypothetical protein